MNDPMAEVHRLIVQKGVEEARRQAAVVEAAYQVLSEEEDRLGFTYSGFALTSLPHKPQKDGVWKREGHNLTLLVQTGVDQSGGPLGLPYGSYARFILLFLQSQAVKTRSRDIELGRSMRVWLNNMGLSIGGTTYKMVNEQARRISGCTLTFYSDRSVESGRAMMRKGGFVDGAITLTELNDDRPQLWQERVLLNEEFYRALREHPVPLSETALRAIGPRSAVIDIYIWLAYRLHALKADVDVSWVSLFAQFGAGYGRLRDFRAGFLTGLEMALAVYPEAKVGLSESGVVLRPSKPAVARVESGRG